LLILVWVQVAFSVGATPARADDAEQKSRTHFQLGREHLELREYDEAIHEFEIGYQLKPLPLFLYNIAQVAYTAGEKQKALDNYRRYLKASPHAPERALVTARIDELEQVLANEPPPPPPAATPTPVNIAPSAAATTTPTSTAVAPSLVATDQPPPQQPKHKKKWIALAVVGAVVLVGAVAAGVAITETTSQTEYKSWGTLTVIMR
jgi:tetratricopeptide (TPR) repeat protein